MGMEFVARVGGVDVVLGGVKVVVEVELDVVGMKPGVVGVGVELDWEIQLGVERQLDGERRQPGVET